MRWRLRLCSGKRFRRRRGALWSGSAPVVGSRAPPARRRGARNVPQPRLWAAGGGHLSGLCHAFRDAARNNAGGRGSPQTDEADAVAAPRQALVSPLTSWHDAEEGEDPEVSYSWLGCLTTRREKRDKSAQCSARSPI